MYYLKFKKDHLSEILAHYQNVAKIPVKFCKEGARSYLPPPDRQTTLLQVMIKQLFFSCSLDLRIAYHPSNAFIHNTYIRLY